MIVFSYAVFEGRGHLPGGFFPRFFLSGGIFLGGEDFFLGGTLPRDLFPGGNFLRVVFLGVQSRK